MKQQYPKTPLMARFGYLLMLVAALALSYPILFDIYHHWDPAEEPRVSDANGSLPSIHSANSSQADAASQADADSSGLKVSAQGQTARLGASEESAISGQTKQPFIDATEGDAGSVVNAVASIPQSPSAQSPSDSGELIQPVSGSVLQSGTVSGQKRKVSKPIVQKTPRHDGMLTPGDFSYLGAFRLPHVQGQKSRFAYGGHAITFCPTGDQAGSVDGFSGSLFMVGHKDHELVTEVSIPQPYISATKSMDELPVAKIIQPFADITVGRRDQLTAGSSEAFQFGGMHYQNDRLHWTLFKYYNVSGVDYLSHGVSSSDLSQPAMAGMWHLGPRNSGDSVWHSYKHAGYVADIPKNVADKFFGGRSLMSGLQISTGLQYSSQGPALYAYQAPTGSEAPGSSLDAVPMLWYSTGNPIDQHHPADLWTGAAWVNIGGKHAVVIVGRKALGPVYYGDARPNDCYPDKGYHGSGYEVQMLFYAPAHLLKASQSRVADIPPFSRWDSNTEGGGIDRFMFQGCGRDVGGLAYDRKNNLLYLSEMNAGLTSDNEWESLPVIHVFRLGGVSSE